MNGSMRSGLDATARKKSNGKLLPSNNALSKNQNGHSHANLLLATGGGAGGTGEKGDLIDQQLLRHGKEISISHESLPANHVS